MPELEVQLKPPELLPEKIAHLFYRLTLGLFKRKKDSPHAEPVGGNEGDTKTQQATTRNSANFFLRAIDYLTNIFERIYNAVGRFLSAKTFRLPDDIKAVLNGLVNAILKVAESAYLSIFPPSRSAKQSYKSGLDKDTKQWIGFFIIGLLGFLLAISITALSPRHAVIFAIMPICIFLLFLKPIYALTFYLILSLSLIQNTIWNFPTEICGMPLFMGTPLLLAAILSWVFDLVREHRTFEVVNDTSYVPLIGYWSCLLFSFIFQGGEGDLYYFYIRDFLGLSSCLACYVAVTHIIGNSEKYYKFTLYTIAGIYGYFAYQTIRMASYYGFDTDYAVTAELDGRLSDNNELAAVINITFPLFYCLFLNQKKKSMKALFLGLFFIAIAAIIYTHSRGGLICCAITNGLLFFRVMLPRTKNKVLPIVLLCVMFIAGSFMFSSRVTERTESIMHWKTDPSAQKRILSYVTAINMMRGNPFVGIGFGSINPVKSVFLDYCPDKLTVKTSSDDKEPMVIYKPDEAYEIHNTFLSLGARTGIPSLIFFLIFIIHTIRKMWRFRREIRSDPKTEWAYNVSYAIEIGVIAYSINGIFINSFGDPTIYVYFAMASALWNVVLKPEGKLNKGTALWVLVLFMHWLYYTVAVRA